MKANTILLLLLTATAGSQAQKQVQPLQPVKLSVFKNGTFFAKREALVTVSNQTFYIPAPQQVLLGTYWLSVGKEAGLRSVAIKPDTFRVQRPMKIKEDYLQSCVGKDIVLYRHTTTAETVRLAGKLLAFDRSSNLLRLKTGDKTVIVANASLYPEFEMTGNGDTNWETDSIATTARVTVEKPVVNTMATTISLESGIQWFPSYLLRIVNDKEARLEMKATLVNNTEQQLYTPVDIIIGNPEMFFGKQLDPACTAYFAEELLQGRVSGFAMQTVNVSNVALGRIDAINEGMSGDGKDGEQFEDLYYYKLGMLRLDAAARVIVPVLTTAVNYQDMYVAELDVNSSAADENKPLEAWHSYRIVNNTTAPFTAGAVLVMNASEQPVAQSLLGYTPVKGSNEIRLSKALNLQLKNEETELKREKSAIKKGYDEYKDRMTYQGTVQVTNYLNKTITIRISKTIQGTVLKMSDEGKARKIRNADDEDDTVSRITWEVEVAPGGKKNIQYTYSTIN